MELEGTLTVQRPVQQARSALMDVRRLAACVPGCTGVSSVDGDRFTAEMLLDLPLVRLPAQVDGRLERSVDGLRVHFAGRPGTLAGAFRATVDLSWRPEAAATRIDYRLSLVLKGRLASLGEAMVRATSPAKAREFETRLADALNEG